MMVSQAGSKDYSTVTVKVKVFIALAGLNQFPVAPN
jgi:hypothetical protein